MQPMLNIALRAARSAGELIIRSIERLDVISVNEKDAHDYVSEVDRAAEQTIIQALGTNERGQSYTWQCSYLTQTRNSVDSKKLAAAYPTVYADVAKQSTSTVFRATKKKEGK